MKGEQAEEGNSGVTADRQVKDNVLNEQGKSVLQCRNLV